MTSLQSKNLYAFLDRIRAIEKGIDSAHVKLRDGLEELYAQEELLEGLQEDFMEIIDDLEELQDA